MKKRSKWLAVLLCAWNLYMPTNINAEQELKVENKIVEIMDDDLVDVEDEDEEDVTKRKSSFLKRIIYFIPSLFYSLVYGIISIITGIVSMPLLALLIFLLLLLAGFLYLKNKPWGCIVGILAGILVVYMGIQNLEEMLTEITGMILVFLNIGGGVCIYKKVKICE